LVVVEEDRQYSCQNHLQIFKEETLVVLVEEEVKVLQQQKYREMELQDKVILADHITSHSEVVVEGDMLDLVQHHHQTIMEDLVEQVVLSQDFLHHF
jgi:hypothetical protein